MQTVSAKSALQHCEGLIQQKKFGSAQHLLTQMLEQQPESTAVLYLLSRLNTEQLKLNEGIGFLEQAIQFETQAAVRGRLLAELGESYTRAQQFDQAITAYRTSIDCHYQVADNTHRIGDIERRLGHFEKAEELFRENIEHNPDFSLSYGALSALRSYAADDPLFGQIETRLKNPAITDKDRSSFSFALGKLHDDIGEHKSAFEYFLSGNKAKQTEFNWRENQNWMRLIAQTYTDLQTTPAVSANEAEPIFIVGMPRSGTSLTEQILASHSQLFGAGETPLIKAADHLSATQLQSAPYPQQIKQLTSKQLDNLAVQFLDQISALNRTDHSATRYVEKNPINFIYIGFILQLFPNAQFIHTQRHPLDT